MLLSAIIAALVLAAVLECVIAWRHLQGNARLADVAFSADGHWPSVSVIMAARDEAGRIGPALASRIADDYPDLELVLVDDRSTDGTGHVARRVAGNDPRMRIVRVDDLPAGWLGKVHALDAGVRVAKGDYLLFSDADVTVARDTLKRAVTLCEGEDVDCLALVPEFSSPSVLVDAVWTVFMRVFCLAFAPAKIADPQSETAIGSGGFTLVRSSVFERTPGFEHLRMETGDDMALARMVKAAGGRCRGVVGAGCASVRTYDSLAAFGRGIEKNGATTAAHPVATTVGMAVFAAIEYAPLVGTAAGPTWLRALGAAAALVQWVANVAILRATCRAWAPALLWPIGTALLVCGVLRATWLAVIRRGVAWRGTFYPLAELDAGRRYTL